LVEHAHSPSFGVAYVGPDYYDRVAKMLLAGEISTNFTFRPLLIHFLASGTRSADRRMDMALLVQHLSGGTGLLVACLARVCFSIA